MNREKLWILGALLVIFGGFLFGLFVLSNEGFYYFSGLITYTIGFLITGLITSFFGFLLTLTCLDQNKSQIKADNATKIRIVLTAMTIIYLPLIGYLIRINQEWTIRPLIIESFQPSFGFYETFTLSSHSALFAALLMFGIFVLPFVVTESGILDDHSVESTNDLEEGQTIHDAEDSFSRFVVFLKRRFGSIKNIRKYALPLGITLALLGSCLVGLPHLFFIDGPLTYDLETETWFIKDYKGFIRGKLLLIGIVLFVIGLVLIICHFRRNSNSAAKEKLKR